jgi:hypothetical protein
MKGCTRCGVCCLNALPFGLPVRAGSTVCAHLGEDFVCSIYESRPEVCRVGSWTPEVDAMCDVLYAECWGAGRR